MLTYMHVLQKKIPLPDSLRNPSVERNLNARAEIPQLVNISDVVVMRDLLNRIRVVQIHCARTGVFLEMRFLIILISQRIPKKE